MNAIPFDTLKLAQDLRDNAGMSQAHAEGMVKALAAAFDGEVATRADIAELKAAIAHLRAETKAEISEQRAETKAEISDLRVETKADIKALETKMDRRFAESDAANSLRFTKIEADIAALEHRMTIKLGGMMIVAVGAMATLTKLL